MSDSPPVPFQMEPTRRGASAVDESLMKFSTGIPSLSDYLSDAGLLVSTNQPIMGTRFDVSKSILHQGPWDFKKSVSYQGMFDFAKGVFRSGSSPTEWTVAGEVPKVFTYGAALEDYQSFAIGAGGAERFELSAMNMLMHVIVDENVVMNSNLLEEIVATSAARRRELKAQVANIEAFEARLRALWTGFEEAVDDEKPHSTVQRDAYWTRVRGDLQQWFCMGLKDLADVIGVAKATLIYIDRPGRQPRPSTTRKVMDLHAIGVAVLGALGPDRGRDWLSTTGLSCLQQNGVAALDRAAAQMLYRNRRSEDAITYREPEDEIDALPYQPPKQSEARAF